MVLVGSDPASQIYVASKCKQCQEVGIISQKIELPATTSQDHLEKIIADLNQDSTVHGILVQMPLPPPLDSGKILSILDPKKDVDGLTFVNLGKLYSKNTTGFCPCTPQGILHLIRAVGIPLVGKKALVIGRSQLVGLPTAQLLLQADCTVTIAHSKTKDLKSLCLDSEIIVAACGQPHLVRGDWIHPGTIVIDVGIHRQNGILLGDVAAFEILDPSVYLSPVPRGVGPLTVAYLLYNTLLAAQNLTKS